jgi:hypothetical protein
MSVSNAVQAQSPVPFTLTNNSAFADANVYVAVVGIANDQHVWIDTRTGAVNPMSSSYNTVTGPVIGGNQGPGNNAKYAACFARLSEIPNKTIRVPAIAGCRILISFNSQLYLYFFGASGAPSGYAAPNLANPTDPNQGIRYETIELANTPTGLWANTTRVDAYQYPMGLEVWGGNNYYGKVGELVSHSYILSQWQATAPAAFAGCYDATNGIIHFPSKTTAFQPGGAQASYFNSYIDAIWSKYTSGPLVINVENEGILNGRVSGNVFTFTKASNGEVGTISNKPTQTEALEGSGVMASGGRLDKVVQAQICAAINRHAIDLTKATGVTQDLSPASGQYYQTAAYNWYCKFFHRADLSLNSKTYAFCYDDTYDQSATLTTPSPTRATVTIGGFAGLPNNSGPVTVYKDCNYAGTAVNLNAGNYTLSQLNAAGILNDDISSLKITSGYKVTLYKDDNFTGRSVVLTADNSCLVANTFNDSTSSLKIETNTTSTSIKIEAENYNYMSGVETEATTDAGGGLNVAYIDAGDWMSYEVTIPTTGSYVISYRVASPNSGSAIRLEKDAGTTQLGTVTVPNTGGWQNWANVSHTVSLPAGTYSIGLATTTGGFNLNYLTITKTAAALSVAAVAAPAKTGDQATSITLSPNPVKEQLYIRGNELIRTMVVYDMAGHAILSKTNPGTSVDVASLTPGIYIIKIYRKDGSQKTVKILKH